MQFVVTHSHFMIHCSEWDGEYRYDLRHTRYDKRWTVEAFVAETDWGIGWQWVPKTWFFTEKVIERGEA